jgi:hypothetical protein
MVREVFSSNGVRLARASKQANRELVQDKAELALCFKELWMIQGVQIFVRRISDPGITVPAGIFVWVGQWACWRISHEW